MFERIYINIYVGGTALVTNQNHTDSEILEILMPKRIFLAVCAPPYFKNLCVSVSSFSCRSFLLSATLGHLVDPQA